MRFFIVGGAGFIGSHLAKKLVQVGRITLYDNFSVGKLSFIETFRERIQIIQGDALDASLLTRSIVGHDWVIHLAANPEARWGLSNTRLDLEQGTIATYNVLEAMRISGVKNIVFASSGTVYGETSSVCNEHILGLPISLYGASKLACESLISAFVECFNLNAWIFRFGNVVGPHATHGVILDLFKKLRENPTQLEVLGDGSQSKPYLHVSDCIDGIVHGISHARDRLNIYNLSPEGATTVREIAHWCVAASPYPHASIVYTGGSRGWKGDVPYSRLSPEKLASIGFRVSMSSNQAVQQAITEIASEVFS